MISRNLPAALFEHPELMGRRWTPGRRLVGRHTDLLEVLEEGGAGRLFVKQLRVGTRERADPRLRREYRALRVLRQRLGPEFTKSVPVVFGVHQDDKVLVVGALEGVPLSHVLKREANLLTGFLCGRRLEAMGYDVGRWLRRFHDRTARPPALHDHGKFCQLLDEALERFGDRLSASDGVWLRSVLGSASSRLAAVPLRTAARHGDFLPQNILVRADGIGVLDFENYRVREPVHRDVGYMLAYVSLLRVKRGYLPSALNSFARGFQRAYGVAAGDEAQRLFTAEGAVRIARDSASRGAATAMLKTVAELMSTVYRERTA